MNFASIEQKHILQLVSDFGSMRSSEIIIRTGLSGKTVYKHLTRLVEQGLLKKLGTTPRVYYSVVSESQEDRVMDTFNKDDLIIEHNYVYVSPSGEIFRGINGFVLWCKKNNFNFDIEKPKIVKKLTEIHKSKSNGLISAKKNILSSKGNLAMDEIFFSDFYSIDYFGKTKLGQLVYLAKSSQSRELIAEIAVLIKPAIENLIKTHSIKHICFIPPTIDRKLQFLDELRRKLMIDLPEIKAAKLPNKIRVPQKTLRKLEDRIINASTTITVSPTQKITGNVLIIDDATGSGSTLNETAKKIRKIADFPIKVIGYSVVGSYKGFDVISEV